MDRYVVATTNLMEDNTIFTEGCLNKLAEINHVEVNRNFNFDDRIGVAKNFTVKDGKLECEIQIVKESKNGFFVPSISDIKSTITEDGALCYSDAKLTSIGLVQFPCDYLEEFGGSYDG